MLVNVQDIYGNQGTILTEAAIVIVRQNIFSEPHTMEHILGILEKVKRDHAQFVTDTEAPRYQHITVSMGGGFVMLNHGVFLDRSIHLHWVFRRMQKAWRTKRAALAVAMGQHPRLGNHSLIRTLPTDLVRRIVMLT